MKTVLFVCTANYFRSRYAEVVCNHRLRARGLPWKAVSCGILADRIAEADVAPYVMEALNARGIPPQFARAGRTQLTERMMREAARVISMDRREHQPLLFDLFPRFYDHVTYWDVPDVDVCPPHKAFVRMDEYVDALVSSLAGHAPGGELSPTGP